MGGEFDSLVAITDSARGGVCGASTGSIGLSWAGGVGGGIVAKLPLSRSLRLGCTGGATSELEELRALDGPTDDVLALMSEWKIFTLRNLSNISEEMSAYRRLVRGVIEGLAELLDAAGTPSSSTTMIFDGRERRIGFGRAKDGDRIA